MSNNQDYNEILFLKIIVTTIGFTLFINTALLFRTRKIDSEMNIFKEKTENTKNILEENSSKKSSSQSSFTFR